MDAMERSPRYVGARRFSLVVAFDACPSNQTLVRSRDGEVLLSCGFARRLLKCVVKEANNTSLPDLVIVYLEMYHLLPWLVSLFRRCPKNMLSRFLLFPNPSGHASYDTFEEEPAVISVHTVPLVLSAVRPFQLGQAAIQAEQVSRHFSLLGFKFQLQLQLRSRVEKTFPSSSD